MKEWFKSIWTNAKFYVILAGILVCVFFGLSKITLSQQQHSEQHVTTTQTMQNNNINIVYAGQTWLVTNEQYWIEAKSPAELMMFINSLNYYQQTRMHIIGPEDRFDRTWKVIYPITPKASSVVIVTNWVSNNNENTNSVQIKPRFSFKWPWQK